jgi:dethiobiotin synthetase
LAHLIITGTDTGVGKTYFACLLVKALREAGVDAVGYKPVCCGERTDAELLLAAAESAEPIEAVNPVWYQAPVAPAVAAELESKPVALSEYCDHAEDLAARHEVIVMEGVGGWEVPLTQKETFADLAEALGWPVILVAANRLGMLNHALLTEHAIRDRGLTLAALVMNHLAEERDVAMVTNRAILAERLQGPLLVELMSGQDWLEDELVARVKA